MADSVRWGILSTSSIARRAVIPALHAAGNCEVVAVASRDLAKAQAFAAESSIPRAYGSYEELLADPMIDAIYNPLPNHLHAEWAIKAANAGKASLVEKAFTVTGTEAQQVVERFQAAELLVAEAFMYRFHPQTNRVREMVAGGAIGELHVADAAFMVQLADPTNHRFRKALGGGALLDVGCYALSALRLYAGEPEVMAATGALNEDGVDLRAAALLRFPNGAAGTLACDFQAQYTQHVDLRGSAGRIRVQRPFSITPDAQTVIEYWHGSEFKEITIAPANHYQLMVEDFAGAVLGRHAPRFPAEEAVRQMQALDQIVTRVQ